MLHNGITLTIIMFLEIELKLHIAPEDANLLHDHPLILEHIQGESELHYLTSLYYDTPEHDLYKQGLGFRVRQSEQRFYQTVKSSGHRVGDLHHRHEWETEIDGPEPDLAASCTRAPALRQSRRARRGCNVWSGPGGRAMG